MRCGQQIQIFWRAHKVHSILPTLFADLGQQGGHRCCVCCCQTKQMRTTLPCRGSAMTTYNNHVLWWQHSWACINCTWSSTKEILIPNKKCTVLVPASHAWITHGVAQEIKLPNTKCIAFITASHGRNSFKLSQVSSKHLKHHISSVNSAMCLFQECSGVVDT